MLRTPAGLVVSVYELAAVCDAADRLWDGGARWETARAGQAVAGAATATCVSVGAHLVTPYVAEDEGPGRGAA